MIVRNATINDSETIAECLLLAMEDIVYKFTGEEHHESAKAFLQYFIEQEDNQYSYQNCLVAEDNGEIVAAVNVYDGANLYELRLPVINYITAKFHRNITPEDETQAGEFYIDSLGVHPNRQGEGIGSKVLRFLIDDYVVKNNQTLGLLVDEKNPSAKKLYLNLGFKSVGEKILLGAKMEHLQIQPDFVG